MDYKFAHRRYSLPFRAPVRTAHGLWTQREGIIVRLENENGDEGFGECAPIPWFGTETADEAAGVCASFGERLDDAQIDAIPERCACLRFAFKSARISLGARASCARTGDDKRAQDARVPGALPVAALLPAGRAALEKIGPLGEAGFRTFKWKVGVAPDPADEIALLDDVLAALPAGSRLRLDANGAWTRRVAERWLSRCAEYPVEFVEQPVAASERGAEDLLLGLAGDYPTPLALDESLISGGDVARWLGAGWPGIFVVKPSLLGNVARALEQLAPERVVFSSALETAVSAQAALRVAFDFYAHAGILKPRALGFGVWPLFVDARFDGPASAPFLRAEDVGGLYVQGLWNALI